MVNWYKTGLRGPYVIRKGKYRAQLPYVMRKKVFPIYRKAWPYVKPVVIAAAKAAGNTELKYVDVDVSGLAVGYTAWSTPQSLVAPSQDVTQEGRIGKSIRAMSINLKGTLTSGASATLNQYCRIVIFQERLANVNDTTFLPVAPEPLNVFDNELDSQRSMAFASRFKVLYDRRFVVSPPGDPLAKTFFQKNIKLGHHLKFPSDAADIPEKGGVYLIALSDTDTAGAKPTLSYTCRARYYDD